MAQAHEGFKNPQTLTQWVRYFLYLQIAVAVISMGSGYLEYQVLTDMRDGVYVSEELMMADVEASDLRQQIVAISYLVVFLVSGFFILKWIYRANYNVRQLGARGMHYTPGWSVGWYFVPILNLWKPYGAMKEIWDDSQALNDWRESHGTPLLVWWWICWLGSGFFGQLEFRTYMDAEDIDDYVGSNIVTQISDISSILLALVFLSVVNGIYEAQMTYARKNGLVT